MESYLKEVSVSDSTSEVRYLNPISAEECVEYTKIKNFLFLLRTNISDQKEIGENFFTNNKNEKVRESLISITENLNETEDIRLQAIVLLRKIYNYNVKGRYLRYERDRNEMELKFENKKALMSEEMLKESLQNKPVKFNSSHFSLIDSLPYIDQHYSNEKYIKEEMNRLINLEMMNISSSRSYDDYLKSFPIPKISYLDDPLIQSDLVRIEKNKKLDSFTDNINDKFENPPPNKYHDEENWNKLTHNIYLSMQHLNVKNLNLDLLIKFGPESWKKYLSCFESLVNQLEAEKNSLEKMNDEINKERKLAQTETLEILNEKQGKLNHYINQTLDLHKECFKLRFKIKKLIRYKRKKLRLNRKELLRKYN